MPEIHYTDDELVQLLSQNDQKAFESIYNSYWERLYAMAYNRLGSKENAEGLVQDIFTELWDRRAKLTVYQSLAAFLFSALKYKIINHFASLAVRRRYVEEKKKLTSQFDNATEEWLSFDELNKFIELEIDKLPEKCRLVFQLNQEGKSSKEIGQELNISSRTAEGHINQARKTLKSKLSGLNMVMAFLYIV